MNHIDIIEIERQARQLRAAEMRRLNEILAARAGIYLHLLGRTLLSVGGLVSAALRPLFSWNPRELHLR